MIFGAVVQLITFKTIFVFHFKNIQSLLSHRPPRFKDLNNKGQKNILWD